MVLGGGEESSHYLKQLNQEFFIVLVDKNQECAGKEQANYFIACSIYDPEKILAKLNKHDFQKKIDAVMCLGSDATISVATICEHLNLESVPLEAAKISSNKIKLKKLFNEIGINTPNFTSIKKSEDLLIFIKRNKLPIIIKPDDSRGSRGVNIIWKQQGLKSLYLYARNYSSTGTIIAEEFIDGRQISTESVIYRGRSYTIGFSDRNYEFISKSRSQVIENGGDLPTSLTDEYKNKINLEIERIATSLGVKNGIIKGDIIVKDSKIYFVEIALRLSGGFFSSHKIPYSTGVNLVDIAARIALKEEIDLRDLKAKMNKPVSQRFLIPKNGKIKSYNKSFHTNNREILFSNIMVPIKKKLGFPKNHTERCGCVIATGRDRSDAIQCAENYIKNIKPVYE